VDDIVGEGKREHEEGAEDFAPAVGVAVEGFFGEEAFEDVLTKGGEEAVADLYSSTIVL
jgi:hypothetical protein